jgi:hypothetical protein
MATQVTLGSGVIDSASGLKLRTNGTTEAVDISTGQVATLAKDAVVNGLTVGRGAGAVSTNTAVGASALAANQAGGTNNTAIGNAALDANTTGDANTAVGDDALGANTTASNNTAVGYQAGYAQTTADGNALFGYQAGNALTTGNLNSFFGAAAGGAITTGTKNTIIGRYNGNQGGLDIRTASNYVVLSDGDGVIHMSSQNGAGVKINLFNAGAGTNAVKFNTSTGAVTYDTSSARYKDNIRDSVYGLSHVMQMRSTQFEYKDDGRSDVGLIAEELQPIIPELVGINKEGQADSVSYDRMVSVLVKAIQELKAEFDAYKATHP